MLAADALGPPSSHAPTTDVVIAHNDTGSLEREKLRLEVQKLGKDVAAESPGWGVQWGTLIAAIIAGAISLWSALRTFKGQRLSLLFQERSQREDRISELLGRLGSGDIRVRMSAVQALSEYEDAVPFLIDLVQLEESRDVISSAILALQKFPEKALPLLVSETKAIHSAKIDLLFSLTCMGVDGRELAINFTVHNYELTEHSESQEARRMRRVIEQKKLVASYAKDSVNGKILKHEIDELYRGLIDAERAHHHVIRALEGIVATLAGDRAPQILRGAVLRGFNGGGMDFSGWDFSNCELSGASFQRANCRKANFSGVTAIDVSFRNADLSDAVLRESSITQGDFRGIQAKGIDLSWSMIHRANFERAELDDACLHRVRLSAFECRNMNGRRIILTDSSLHNGIFHTCRLSGANFSGAKVISVRMLSSRANRCIFDRAKLVDVLLQKNEARRANFETAYLKRTTIFNNTFTGGTFPKKIYMQPKGQGFIVATKRSDLR